MSSRQTESRPPDSRTTTGRPAASRPVTATRSSRSMPRAYAARQGVRWATRTNVLICASGTPGPSPPGRDAHATNGRLAGGAVNPGAVSEAFSCGETSSGAVKAPNTGRRDASTCPSPSDVASIRTQLTIAVVPLLAAAPAFAGWAAPDSACGGPKRPSAPATEARTRVLGPSGVAGAPGSPPTQARIAPRDSA